MTSSQRASAHFSYPAIAPRGDGYATLLGWYETEQEAVDAVDQFLTAEPFSLSDFLNSQS